MSNAHPIVDQITGPLMGRVVHSVERGIGSFLSIDFGPRDESAPRSEWHLWVYMTDWRLEGPEGLVVGSGDDGETIDAQIGVLAGTTIQAISIDTDDTVFDFTGGIRLRVITTAPGGDDQWMLFTPEDTVLSMQPGGRWRYEPAGGGTT